MRLPQELVDSIIDHVGITSAQSSDKHNPTHPHESQSAKDLLKSFALTSRACNHRARSHLFAKRRLTTNVLSTGLNSARIRSFGTLVTVNQHVCCQIKILPLLSRIASSQLVTMTLLLPSVPKELPETLRSSFPNICSLAFYHSLFDRSTLVNSIGPLEHLDMLHIQGCYLMPPTEDEEIPSLPPLKGQLSILDFNPIDEFSRIPLLLRSLRYASIGLPPEDKLINA